MKTKLLPQERVFNTQDIQLAASLYALGANMLTIDRSNSERCSFIFSSDAALEGCVEAYWHKKLTIEPQTLLGALKAIKSRLYGER
jgi:hypothetical protein